MTVRVLCRAITELWVSIFSVIVAFADYTHLLCVCCFFFHNFTTTIQNLRERRCLLKIFGVV